MIKIYLRVSDIPENENIIYDNETLFNKDYFNKYTTYNNDLIKHFMKELDDVEFIKEKNVIKKGDSLTSLKDLSNDCKTAINVVLHHNLIISCDCCSRITLKELLYYSEKIKGIIYLPNLKNIDDNFNIDVCVYLGDKEDYINNLKDLQKLYEEVL